MSKQPVSFRAALDAARLGIAVQNCNDPVVHANPARVNLVNPPEGNTLQSTLNTLTGLVSHMTSRLDKLENNQSNITQSRDQGKSSGSQSSKQRRPQRNVVCWKCGFTGHKIAHCYAIRDRDGRPLN
jgi:hypothetical protein